MTTSVLRNDALNRYELFVDGGLAGVADFHPVYDATVLSHTMVEPSLRAQGLGDVLVRSVLEDLRSRGEQVVPACSFVASFVESHPEFQDLVVPA